MLTSNLVRWKMENVLPNISGLMIQTQTVMTVKETASGADNSGTVLITRAGQSLQRSSVTLVWFFLS